MNSYNIQEIIEVHTMLQTKDPVKMDQAFYHMSAWSWDHISMAKAMFKVLELDEAGSRSVH